MKAEHRAERRNSKKSRQHAAPPTRAKVGGLGIAEEFVDPPLDHEVTQLTTYSRLTHHYSPSDRECIATARPLTGRGFT